MRSRSAENFPSIFTAELLPEIDGARNHARMFDRSFAGGMRCACEALVATRTGAGHRPRSESDRLASFGK